MSWRIEDIPWDAFDPAKVDTALMPIIKAASLVEFNGRDYARYLCEVFADDEEFKTLVRQWGTEEEQHGIVLRKWAEMADLSFNFEESFQRFTKGFRQLPTEVKGSTRGSRTGELVARCIVETGTSNYYTAIKEATDEPLLKVIAAKIAADEHRHYKLFYSWMQKYREKERLGFWKRLWVALSRVGETEDDELAYAYYAANTPATAPYSRETYVREYGARAFALYGKRHVDSMVAMVFKAVGLKPHSWIYRAVSSLGWWMMERKRLTTVSQQSS